MAGGRTRRPVASIGEVVRSVFGEIEQKKSAREALDDAWKEVAGEKAYKHSRPSAVRKNVLKIRVDSSGWLQELTIQKRKLLKGLKRLLGRDRIHEIHFKIGEF